MDFPDLIILRCMNGLDVGEVDHSKVFPDKSLPFEAKKLQVEKTFL